LRYIREKEKKNLNICILQKGKQTLDVAAMVIQANSRRPCTQKPRFTFMLAVTCYNHVALSEFNVEMHLLTAAWDMPFSMG